jgi:hypothetical protein
MFSHVRTPAELSETSDDQVTNLIELWVTTDQEHVSCDTIGKHLFPSDAIITQCKEDPAYICLNLCVADNPKGVKQVHDSFFNQNIDGLLRKGKVNQGQS